MQQILKFPKLKIFAVGIMTFFICFSCMMFPVFAEDNPTDPTKQEEKTSENQNQTVNDDTLVEEQKEPTSEEEIPNIDEIISANGTVVDYAKNKNREFYTIVTNDKTVFYLIVDHEKDNENVYFLRNINDADFKVKDNITKDEVTDQGTVDPNNIDGKENKTEVDPFYIMIGVVLLGVFAAGYYVKIVKPKKEKNKPQEVKEEDLHVNYDDDFDEDGEQNLVDESENMEE